MTALSIALVRKLAEFNALVALCEGTQAYHDYLAPVGFMRDFLNEIVVKMAQEGQVDAASTVVLTPVQEAIVRVSLQGPEPAGGRGQGATRQTGTQGGKRSI